MVWKKVLKISGITGLIVFALWELLFLTGYGISREGYDTLLSAYWVGAIVFGLLTSLILIQREVKKKDTWPIYVAPVLTILIAIVLFELVIFIFAR